jgi:hypothetical protein
MLIRTGGGKKMELAIQLWRKLESLLGIHIPKIPMIIIISILLFILLAMFFVKAYKMLLQPIIKKTTELKASKLFPGTWKNTFTDKNGIVDFEEFRIINKNQYHILNKSNGQWEHAFDITNCKEHNGTIEFAKMKPGGMEPFSYNNLERISKNKMEGNEVNETHVIYERIK